MTLPKITLAYINRKVLYITAGVLLVAGLLAYGIVREVQAEQAASAKASYEAEQRHKQAQATTLYIKAVEAQRDTEKQSKTAVCAYVKQLDGNRLITRSVDVPAACL